MITLVLMLINKIEAAGMVAAFLGIAWAAYILLFAVIKANRGKKQFKTAFICGAVATLVCDIVWFFKFFDGAEFLNPDAATYLWFLLIFVLMLLLVMAQSYINVNRYQHEETRRLKETEKNRKKESRKKKFDEASVKPAPVKVPEGEAEKNEEKKESK